MKVLFVRSEVDRYEVKHSTPFSTEVKSAYAVYIRKLWWSSQHCFILGGKSKVKKIVSDCIY